MAITINWATKVITIPKADLTPLGGLFYELDINVLRLALKDLEDDEAGMIYPVTHNHNSTVLVGGLTLARVVEIINGYTITFEDGQYAVSLVGANSNILDVVNLNQVSVRSSNSAGLVQVAGGVSDTKIDELHKIHGLDPSNPVTVTPSSRVVGGISQDITGDGETTSTITRV